MQKLNAKELKTIIGGAGWGFTATKTGNRGSASGCSYGTVC
ncbi:MAG: bacteriocin [Planctomycetaceae bacterium]|nr:bacteriocin [Planctomycetaceae bacterium]